MRFRSSRADPAERAAGVTLLGPLAFGTLASPVPRPYPSRQALAARYGAGPPVRARASRQRLLADDADAWLSRVGRGAGAAAARAAGPREELGQADGLARTLEHGADRLTPAAAVEAEEHPVA